MRLDAQPDLISKEDAKRLGLRRYFTGLPCRLGHIAARNVGANNECAECKKARDADYTARNKDRKASYDRDYRERTAEHLLEIRRRWLEANPDYVRNYSRRYYAENADVFAAYRIENRDKRNAQKREWSQRNRSRVREYSRTATKVLKAKNLNYRLACGLRSRLAVALRGRTKGGSAVKDLGCSIVELRAHLEAQFLPGMTWANWGRRGWHVDHRIPLAAFDLSDPDQVRIACHFTNLRPLWAFDNLSKGAGLTWVDAQKARAG